jgi:Alginate lyase
MTPRLLAVLCLVSFFAATPGIYSPLCATVDDFRPRLFLWYPDELIRARERIHGNDAALLSALGRLEHDALRALDGGTYSVVHKKLAPPSGDKHDYMSIAPYWWPNPSTRDGLPYVQRDGEVNPERDDTSDRQRLDNLVQRIKTLAIGYFFTGKEEYATHVATLLRAWFLDDATKMTPHLKYAQAVPGRNVGRGAGIIETHNLPELVDAIGLLSGSKSWSSIDHKPLQDWFRAYLAWLIESPEGKAEANAVNNHGSWYDVQLASYALFVGREELAKKVMADFSSKRIAKQIEPDGRQPHELARTRAWDYSIFNLEALFNAASIADKLGIDLWTYETQDRRGVRKALDWLVPFAVGEKKWTYKQISAFQPEKLAPLLRRAALRYSEPGYERAISKITRTATDQRWQLLYPAVASK